MDYAIYKGDTFLCVGSDKECAKFMGVKPETIRWYLSPAYQRRLAKRKKSEKNAIIVIRLEKE